MSRITSCSCRSRASLTAAARRGRGEISLHAFVDLWQGQSLDFSLMIFVVSEALKDLRSAQIRKRGANAVHIPTKKKVGNDIVHTDSCAFDPCVSAADSFGLHDVAIVRCGFHEANYITTFRKTDIVFGWKRLFPRTQHASPARSTELLRREGGDPPSLRLPRGWQARHYFGASEFTIFSKHGSPRSRYFLSWES